MQQNNNLKGMALFSYAIIMSVGMETADFSVCTAVHRYGIPSATIHKIASAEELLSLSVCLVCKIQARTNLTDPLLI
jgi:hypothetical protein